MHCCYVYTILQSPGGAICPRSCGGDDHTENAPASHFEGAKHRDFGGSNENLNDFTGRLSFSNAKAREMAGDNIFGPSPLDAAKKAAHNREVSNEICNLRVVRYSHARFLM